jgi:ESS family glutamate:Na+ symporter
LLQWLLRTEAAASARPVASELASWPGVLIAVVFAAMLRERGEGGGFVAAVRRGARSAMLAWIIILGQIVIGLLVYLALIRPANPAAPVTAGQLLEVSWAGGHGSSSGMAQIYAAQGFPEGRDLAFFLATIGLIYGVISGLVLVNLAIRRGWTSGGARGAGVPVVGGLEPSRDPAPAMYARSRADVLDPLVLQILLLAGAFAIGWAMQAAFIHAAALVLGADDPAVRNQSIDFVQNVPLFLFTLLGGWTLRAILTRLRLDHLIDPDGLRRLVGVAMDFLVVAAIATLRIETLGTYGLAIATLVLLAGAWSAFCLLVLARRLLPRDYWFELGLLNYGFSTANTPQGFMLLRIVDPEFRTRAAEDYAVAAPLSAPFIGGGVVTFVALPAVGAALGAAGLLAIVLVALAALLTLGWRLPRRTPSAADAT